MTKQEYFHYMEKSFDKFLQSRGIERTIMYENLVCLNSFLFGQKIIDCDSFNYWLNVLAEWY